MKRKIIITESQYNKLQEFLFETTDVNHTLDFANVGDVLNFKTNTGSDYIINVKNVDQKNNEILGDNQGNKIRFTFNSYDEQTKKFNFQELDKKTQKYINKEEDFTELDIKRNGQVVQIPDVGGNKQPEPTPAPEPVGKPDEISPEVELDPNVVIANKEEDFDEMIDNIEQEYESDDIFRQALYTQPSFLERLKGEITGKKPQGSGIIIANKLVNSYRDKSSNDKLKADFIKGYWSVFKSLDDVELEHTTDGEIGTVKFIKGGERKAKVTTINEKDERLLENTPERFKILVIKNISNEQFPNTFLCYVSTMSKEEGNLIDNKPEKIRLQFIDSPGFKIKNK
jgi:hypothetical protein